MAQLNLIGGTNEARSRAVSSALSLNLYPEITDGGDNKAPIVSIGTPGTPIWADFTTSGITGKCRGTHWAGNRLFVVFGGGVYRVDVDGLTGDKVLTKIQSISDGPGRVKFADDGFHMLFVDGYSMWSYDIGLMSTTIVPTDAFNFPKDIIYAYTRFVCINNDPTVDGTDIHAPIIANSNKFFWSGVGVQGYLEWEGANFEACSLNSDEISAIAMRQGELYCLGPASYEVFAFTGDLEAPFKRVGGSAANIGIRSPYSVSTISDQIFFVGSSTAGKNQVFMTANGYDVERISTHAIEFAFDKADHEGKSASDIIGFNYQQEGHTFYVITSRNMGKTFVYDLTTKLWHERSTRDPLHNTDTYWFPMFAIFAYNEVLVANDYEPMLLKLDLNTFWDYANPVTNIGRAPIIRRRRMATTWSELRPFKIQELIVDLEAGVGTANGQGIDPMAMLRTSLDGGQNWLNSDPVSIGKMGEYTRRARWRWLGVSNQAVFEITISDPVKVVLISAQLYYELSKHR